MCFVGFIYFTVSQAIARKIKSLRQKLYSEEQIRAIFNKADKDGDKTLNVEDFNKVIVELGLQLDKREAEIAFEGIDKNNDGLIDFDEFYNNFWKEGEFNETKFQFALAV
jgi:Ca2+-binding EF-hand superfamily protein